MKSLHALLIAACFAVGLSLGACSGNTEDATTDAGTTTETKTDAGTNTTTDAGTPADAGTQTNECTGHCSFDGTDDCECFWNADCGSGFRCESTEGSVTGTCKCGARGAKAYDTACTDSNECSSGVCGDDFCSKECETDADCSGSHLTKCNSLYKLCILAPT